MQLLHGAGSFAELRSAKSLDEAEAADLKSSLDARNNSKMPVLHQAAELRRLPNMRVHKESIQLVVTNALRLGLRGHAISCRSCCLHCLQLYSLHVEWACGLLP